MTKKELIEILEGYPDDMLIIMSKDAEGNGFSPLEAYCDAYYEKESLWSGSIYTQEDFDDGYGNPENCIECIVLWPIN